MTGTEQYGCGEPPSVTGTEQYGHGEPPSMTGTKQYGHGEPPSMTGTEQYGHGEPPSMTGTEQYGRGEPPSMTGTEQYGHGEPPSHSAVTAQISLSSVNLNLATCAVDCCHALQNETLLQSFDVFYVAKTNLYFIKNKLQCFLCFLRSFYSLLLASHKFLEPNKHLTLATTSDAPDSFIVIH